jgi:CheY-like chemotaxis protein
MRPLRPVAMWRGTRVLVIEDHADSRDLLRQILQSVGVHVLMAGNGAEGLRVATSEPPDLILCDLKMPVMDGFTFLDQLRRMASVAHIPVVAVTALGGEADLLRTWQAGFDGHLTKPIDHDSVVATVDRVFGRRDVPDEADD